MAVSLLPPERAADAVTVLCEAFHDYPVMRWVLGTRAEGYDERLRSLVDFFVHARVHRGEPVLGLLDGKGALSAVGLVTLPGERETPRGLVEHREALWAELGAEARGRYEAFGAAAARFAIDRDHHHLNMIGVRRALLGRGLARRLLDTVHRMAARDPGSAGVTLSTEDQANVALYRHVGYRLLGHARVSDTLETWAFFRAKG